MLTTIEQLLVTGIATGFLYGLVAIEYTLIWNACGLLNFAHAKTITLGAYIFAGTFLKMTGNLNIPSLLGAMLVMALFGALVATIIYIPLRNYARYIAIMATVMMGTAINEVCRLVWGVVPLSTQGFLIGTVKIGEVVVSVAYIYIIVIALLVNIALQIFMKKTKQGRAMTCVSQNKMAAALMGVKVERTMILAVALSFAICGVIGCLSGPLYTVQQTMADMLGTKGFSAGVIGGFGSIPGAIVGGLILGIVENLSCLVVPSIYKDVVAFALLIIFLMVKPEGIIKANREHKVKEKKKKSAEEKV